MKFIFFILCFGILPVNAQSSKFFNNSNDELCYLLYYKNDPVGQYRVYIVLDEEYLSDHDISVLNKINNLSTKQVSDIINQWYLEGRRIESDRPPYITRKPEFPKKRFDILMLKWPEDTNVIKHEQLRKQIDFSEKYFR